MFCIPRYSAVSVAQRQEGAIVYNLPPASAVEDTLQWRHNGRDCVSNNQPHDCLLNRLFRRRSKKTLKLRVTGLTGDRWIPRTNGQWRGKYFHLMTSSWVAMILEAIVRSLFLCVTEEELFKAVVYRFFLRRSGTVFIVVYVIIFITGSFKCPIISLKCAWRWKGESFPNKTWKRMFAITFITSNKPSKLIMPVVLG